MVQNIVLYYVVVSVISIEKMFVTCLVYLYNVHALTDNLLILLIVIFSYLFVISFFFLFFCCIIITGSRSFTLASSKRAKLQPDAATAQASHKSNVTAALHFKTGQTFKGPHIVSPQESIDVGLIQTVASSRKNKTNKSKSRSSKSSGRKTSVKRKASAVAVAATATSHSEFPSIAPSMTGMQGLMQSMQGIPPNANVYYMPQSNPFIQSVNTFPQQSISASASKKPRFNVESSFQIGGSTGGGGSSSNSNNSSSSNNSNNSNNSSNSSNSNSNSNSNSVNTNYNNLSTASYLVPQPQKGGAFVSSAAETSNNPTTDGYIPGSTSGIVQLSTLHRLLNMVSNAAENVSFASPGIHTSHSQNELLKNNTSPMDLFQKLDNPINNVNSLIQKELLDIAPFLTFSDSDEGEDNISSGLPSNRVLRKLADYMVDDDSMTLAVKTFIAHSQDDIRKGKNLDILNRQLFALCEYHINNFLIHHGSSFDDLIKGLMKRDTTNGASNLGGNNVVVPKTNAAANFGLMLLLEAVEDEKKPSSSSSSSNTLSTSSTSSTISKKEIQKRTQQILDIKTFLEHSWIADVTPMIGAREK